jgi:N-acetylglucosamine malate deacetylase 2
MTRSILFVFAHPDDESHWGSGVAARCHDEGARTALVTATRGGLGATGGLCSKEELPQVREQELREAARILNFDALEILPYKDKDLAAAPPDEIRRSLVGAIRREQPAIVVTFDPNGFNLHTDHIAISRFTTDAIGAASDSRWFPEVGAPHVVKRLLWIPPVMPWDSGDFPPRAGVDFLVDTGRWWQQRARALAAHKTQIVGIEERYLKRPDVERLLSFDVLRQGWGPKLDRRPETDVFAGLSERTD